MSANVMSFIGLILQGSTVLLYGFSVYYIWLQLKAVALTGQANVSERLASQSIDILRHVAQSPRLYEYFYENKALQEDEPDRTAVLCSVEIMANFLEHITLQRESLPKASREAWMLYVRDHYNASKAVRDFITQHKDWYADVFLTFLSTC